MPRQVWERDMISNDLFLNLNWDQSLHRALVTAGNQS